jgi:hypothetical protein
MKHKRLQNKIIKLLENEGRPMSTKQIVDYLSTLKTTQVVKNKTTFWQQHKRVVGQIMKRKQFDNLGYDDETRTSVWGLRGVAYAMD